MKFIQYFHKGLLSGDLIQVCGTDGIKPLDGRYSLETCIQEGHHQAGFKSFPAFVVMQGRGFTDAKPISSLIHSV